MADGGILRDQPEWVPGQGSVSSSHDLFQNEHVSAETSTLMNFLGYGPHIRQARRDAYKAVDRHMNARYDGEAMITTGSKAEGLTNFLESDIDKMYVPKSVICLEEGADSSTISEDKNIFKSCSRFCYPGHCRLLLERYGSKTIPRVVKNALCDDGLLSSDLYVKQQLNIKYSESVVQHERAGPSMPRTFGLMKEIRMNRDSVLALQFYCPSILTRWASRHRNWPSPDVVKEVESLGAFVSPVGAKGSDNERVEWRICFNTGENVLINKLNDTQIKLYVLLKMVKNDILKPRKKEVTSFTVKNIVLWIAEKNPQTLFHERSLFRWLHEGLYALRVAIDKTEMPYYMIPERNLMEACALDHEQKLSWIATIDELIEEGPRIILRLPKIRQALIAHPEPLRWYSGRKIELELLQLILMKSRVLGKDIKTDVVMQAIRRRQNEIGMEVIMKIITEGGQVNARNVRNSMLM